MYNKIKVMSIFGTRPEAVKMAPLIKKLEREEKIESIICVTAQHREMLDQVLNMFSLRPEYDLNIMSKNQTLEDITIKVLHGISVVLDQVKPDIVLVHGDTTTTFAAALASFYKKIKIGHVEAGLRTNNMYEPFPEEMNRKLTGSLADIHFSPTIVSKENLLKENIEEKKIFVTGNTSIDMLKDTISDKYIFNVNELNQINYKEKKVIIVTAHRRENIGEPLKNICNAIKRIAEENKDVEIVYPIHKNPIIRETVNDILSNLGRVHLVEPLCINDMHNLLSKSYLVLTDSGGLQEEVPFLGKPVLVLRNVTERPEGINTGALKLIGSEEYDVYSNTCKLLKDKIMYEKMSKAKNPFGDGIASERIVNTILYMFGEIKNRPNEYL